MEENKKSCRNMPLGKPSRNSELTSRMNHPTGAARRCAFDTRTVLAGKGSLRRAEDGAPLPAARRSGLRNATTGGSGGMIRSHCDQPEPRT
jgi:hypothetical protein